MHPRRSTFSILINLVVAATFTFGFVPRASGALPAQATAEVSPVVTDTPAPIDTPTPEAPPVVSDTPAPADTATAPAAASPTAPPPTSGDAAAAPSASGLQVVWANGPKITQPLRSIAPVAPQTTGGDDREINPVHHRPLPAIQSAAPQGITDPSIVQDRPGTGAAMPAASTNFDGIPGSSSGCSGCYPPDTEGDVGYDPATGTKYYMQWVNTSFQIWNVTTAGSPVSVYGPALGNTLFTGLGGGSWCATTNEGDPVVLFDHLANRWFTSQFAWNPATFNDFHVCIALSSSADPTGSWILYDWAWDSTKINDYAKFGVWPDGYYMTVNQFNEPAGTWAGQGVAVFQRSAMLTASGATMIKADVGAVNLYWGMMLPSDLNGPAPAAGTPNSFTEWDDSSWIPGATLDALRVWNFHVDWATPSNSTFGANSSFDPNQMIPTLDVDPNLCGDALTGPLCIVQPSTTQRLDPISDRLMYRMQYRNFGSYQTLVGNHSVDANGADKAGIHWFEMRNNGSGWAVYQQGVYAPDTDSRWMGSIAMDAGGNMALGYSVSSGGTSPSVRYAGRLLGDSPLGLLPQAEVTLVAGAGSQTGSVGRWGDYSTMSLDPNDDCTFWYTQEYYATTSTTGWKTRIGSFKFPGCAASGTTVYTIIGAVAEPPDYGLPSPSSIRNSYAALNNGPVRVTSSGANIIATERLAWLVNGTYMSIAEMMGLPSNQLTDSYVFAWYNDATMDTQLRIGNVSSSPTNVTVTIGTTSYGPYPIPANDSIRPSYPGVNAGPVTVQSTGGVPIVATERLAWMVNGAYSSITEMMGLPANQLRASYDFGWYNDSTMDTQLRIGNVSSSPTNVTVTIGTTSYGPYPIPANDSIRPSYPGVNAGPVRVTSTGANIIATERLAWMAGGVYTSIAEMMGLPDDQLRDTYVFSWYNNSTMDTQLRIGNVGSSSTDVTVTIGTTSYGPYPLLPGEGVRPSYPGVNAGPVTVHSTGSVPIIATERLAWMVNGAYNSITEMLGLPSNQLTPSYVFAWYNNGTMDTQLRIGVP